MLPPPKRRRGDSDVPADVAAAALQAASLAVQAAAANARAAAKARDEQAEQAEQKDWRGWCRHIAASSTVDAMAEDGWARLL
jgi:hypothetical protein